MFNDHICYVAYVFVAIVCFIKIRKHDVLTFCSFGYSYYSIVNHQGNVRNYLVRNFLIRQIRPLMRPEPDLTGFVENGQIQDLLEPKSSTSLVITSISVIFVVIF